MSNLSEMQLVIVRQVQDSARLRAAEAITEEPHLQLLHGWCGSNPVKEDTIACIASRHVTHDCIFMQVILPSRGISQAWRVQSSLGSLRLRQLSRYFCICITLFNLCHQICLLRWNFEALRDSSIRRGPFFRPVSSFPFSNAFQLGLAFTRSIA